MPRKSQKQNLTLLTARSKNKTLQALDDFLLACEAKRLSPKTLRYYDFEVRRFLAYVAEDGVTTLEAIEPNHIRRFFTVLADRGLQANSQHASARAIQAWLNWCVKEGLVERSPMTLVEKPRKDRKILPAFDVADVQAMLEACESPRETAIVLCLIDSGLRASEFVALNRGDVDMKAGDVKVKLGKGRKDRTSFFGPKARRALSQYLASRGRVGLDAALWTSEHASQRLTVSGLQQLLRKLGQRSGVPNVSPHAFRRTCALWCHRNGGRLTEIQRLLGHSDLSVLRQYLDLDDGDVAQAHRQHGPVDSML
jgi:integrase/recombinase XerD